MAANAALRLSALGEPITLVAPALSTRPFRELGTSSAESCRLISLYFDG